MKLCNLLGTLIGVIIGGFITLGVNLYLQKREKKIQYAISNRREIYEPLYNEIKNKHNELIRFQNPFSAIFTLESWNNFAPTIKLRVPKELKKLIKKFDDTARKFDGIYLKANKTLIKHINKNLEQISNELYEGKYNNIFDILKNRIFEDYKRDFYSGRILREEKHSYPPEEIIWFKIDSSITFDAFFNKVCSSLINEEQIVELRIMRKNLVEITEELENYLKSKIEFILKKYESKLLRI